MNLSWTNGYTTLNASSVSAAQVTNNKLNRVNVESMQQQQQQQQGQLRQFSSTRINTEEHKSTESLFAPGNTVLSN